MRATVSGGKLQRYQRLLGRFREVSNSIDEGGDVRRREPGPRGSGVSDPTGGAAMFRITSIPDILERLNQEYAQLTGEIEELDRLIAESMQLGETYHKVLSDRYRMGYGWSRTAVLSGMLKDDAPDRDRAKYIAHLACQWLDERHGWRI